MASKSGMQSVMKSLKPKINSHGSLRLSPDDIAVLEGEADAELASDHKYQANREALDRTVVEVTERLLDLCTADQESKNYQDDIAWLSEHHVELVNFLRPDVTVEADGQFHSRRSTMLGREATQGRGVAAWHSLLFRDALMRLLDALIANSDRTDTAEPQRGLLVKAIGYAYLDRLRTTYVSTKGNPVYIWEAFTLSRKLGWPLPDWVVNYLDRCAANVEQATKRPDNDSGKQAAEMFGLKGQGAKPGAPLGAASRARRDEQIFLYLRPRRSSGDRWSDQTMRTAVTDLGANNATTLRNAYERVRIRLGLPRARLE